MSLLSIDGIYASSGGVAFPSPATFHPVQFTNTATGTGYTVVTVRDCHMNVTTGTVIKIDGTITLTKVLVSDSVIVGTSVMSVVASTPATTLEVDDVTAAVTNLVTTSSPLTVELDSLDVTSSGAIVAVTGAGATPVTVIAGSVTQHGAGAGMSRDGTQVLRVNGLGYPVDLSILTPADQDMANNSNSGLACGVGSAIHHTGGTGNGWKNLYSGTTY